MTTPHNLAAALTIARTLMSPEDAEVLKTASQEEAIWRLHMTLGYALRSKLKLWSEETEELFEDMNSKMPNCLVVEADTASTALIKALWDEAQIGA